MNDYFTIRDMETYGRVIPSALIYAVEIGDNICHRCNSKMATEYQQYCFASNYYDNPIFKANVRHCAFCGALYITSYDYYKNLNLIRKSRFEIKYVKPIRSDDIVKRCYYLSGISLTCGYSTSRLFNKKCPYLQNYNECYYYTDDKYKPRTIKDTSNNIAISVCKYKNQDNKCLNSKCDRYSNRCPYWSGKDCFYYRTKSGNRVHRTKNSAPHFYDPEFLMEPSDYIDWTNSIKTVFVYSSFSYCIRSEHPTCSCNARVYDIYNKKILYLKVFYCKKCERYYIAQNQIDRFTKNKVIPKVRLISLEFLDYSNFREKSDLALYGYNTRKNGLNDHDRENLLSALIENKLMSEHEIISHLNGLISLHDDDPKWDSAVRKYRDDIKYVNYCRNAKTDVNLGLP